MSKWITQEELDIAIERRDGFCINCLVWTLKPTTAQCPHCSSWCVMLPEDAIEKEELVIYDPALPPDKFNAGGRT